MSSASVPSSGAGAGSARAILHSIVGGGASLLARAAGTSLTAAVQQEADDQQRDQHEPEVSSQATGSRAGQGSPGPALSVSVTVLDKVGSDVTLNFTEQDLHELLKSIKGRKRLQSLHLGQQGNTAADIFAECQDSIGHIKTDLQLRPDECVRGDLFVLDGDAPAAHRIVRLEMLACQARIQPPASKVQSSEAALSREAEMMLARLWRQTKYKGDGGAKVEGFAASFTDGLPKGVFAQASAERVVNEACKELFGETPTKVPRSAVEKQGSGQQQQQQQHERPATPVQQEAASPRSAGTQQQIASLQAEVRGLQHEVAGLRQQMADLNRLVDSINLRVQEPQRVQQHQPTAFDTPTAGLLLPLLLDDL